MTDQIDDLEAPDASAEWLEMIDDAERYFDGWQRRADTIDSLYSDLERMSGTVRDREFALFWSNIQVLLPAIYARPPIPVVTPKFKDRRPLYRTASEFLERGCVVSFDMADIDSTMMALRDDLAIVGRGAAWVRYEDDDKGERVCYEFVDRRDFLHEPARRWCDVSWVARRGWLTRREMKERFGAAAAKDASYSTRPGEGEILTGATDHREKCGVWEIWHKPSKSVVWVCEGVEAVLERGDPHLDLEGFFPCPEPAYATLQRRTLIPVPDMVYYKDQLEEINDLTARMHALGRALVVKGFYAAGGEIGEAIETAMNLNDDGKIMVPVSSMAALGASGGDPIIWMPIDQIAQTIISCGELRRQLIEDVYQIVGLSDIMRGQVDADEKLGQSQIKQQNGAARVRDKQQALVRVARDLVRLGAEIMAEKFDRETLVEMAQMELPTDADVKKQVKALEGQAKEELQGIAGQIEQAPPEQQQEIAQQVQQQQQASLAKWGQQIKQAGEQVTIDQVMEFLQDQKLRPFVLDIETDSTVFPDEQAEKAARAEFMTAFNAAMQTVVGAVQAGPEAVALAGGVFKFALAPYRVGRELEGLIDDLVDAAPQIAERMSQQGEGEDDGLAAAQMELAKAEMAKVQSQTEANQANAQLKMQELQLKAAEAQAKTQQDQQKFALELEKTRGTISETEARIRKIEAEIFKMDVDADNQTRQQDREDVKLVADVQARQTDQAMAAQDRQTDTEFRARGEDRADRQQELAERQPPK